MGFSVRSRFKENAETEKASLFHLNRENKNFLKNNHGELKINGQVVDNREEVENEVLTYYGALFNGHHNRDLIDTGKPFVPDDSHLQDFLSGPGNLSPEKNLLLETLSISWLSSSSSIVKSFLRYYSQQFSD